MRCTEARTRLQDLYDTGQAPGGELSEHLAGCAACSRFQAFLRRLGGETRKTLDRAAASLPLPDYPAIFTRAEAARERTASAARRSRLAFASVAAALVACAGIAAGVIAYRGRLDRALVAANVDSFVDELFAEPLLVDTGYPPGEDVSDFRTWLNDPGTRDPP